MRLFVAAYPSPSAGADFAAYVSGLAVGAPRGPGKSLRLVPPERIHLTLVFLGEVPDDREPAVEQAVAAATRGWARAGPGARDRREVPRLRIGGGGRFGRGRFTTVWAGVRGDSAALGDLVTEVRRELRTAKLPFDAKAFRPHVTVARPGDRLPDAQLAADLAALVRYEGPEWPVEAIYLVRSNQGPQISHDRLATFPLQPG